MKPTVRSMTAAVLLGAAFAAIAQTAGKAEPQGQPILPRIPLTLGLHIVQAEVANTFSTRAQGLMFRRQMAANHGMLFVFGQAEQQCMWMKNTYLPLSVAFMDSAGVILNIADMQPLNETTHCSNGPARYALEMNQGWFAGKGLKAGLKVSGLEAAPPPQ